MPKYKVERKNNFLPWEKKNKVEREQQRLVQKFGKEPTCQCRRHRDVGSIPGLGRCPGGGQGNPLQSPCLENPTDRGAWRAATTGLQSLT